MMHSGNKAPSGGHGARASSNERATTGWTIVVADDAPALLELMAAILTQAAARVVTARDGEAAWQAIRTHRPEVAVLDAEMPLRTGPEVAALVRSDPDLASTRILLVTGDLTADGLSSAGSAGADAWLPKPFRPRELLDAVRALVQS